MMTQTHLLIATTMFTRPGQKRRNAAIIAGALIPDIAIYALFVYAIATGIPQSTLWNETYWREPWQTWVTIGNSVPLYSGLLAISLFIAAPKDGRPRWQSLPALFALAALVHLAGDFPFHHDDAHIHFWPFTDWRFHSPVSYWDRDHHGNVFAILEAALGLVLMVLLFRRFKAIWVRALIGLGMLGYIAVPLFFIISTTAA